MCARARAHVHVRVCVCVCYERRTNNTFIKIYKKVNDTLTNEHATVTAQHRGAFSQLQTFIRGWLDTGVQITQNKKHDKSVGLITRDLKPAVTPCHALSHSTWAHGSFVE